MLFKLLPLILDLILAQLKWKFLIFASSKCPTCPCSFFLSGSMLWVFIFIVTFWLHCLHRCNATTLDFFAFAPKKDFFEQSLLLLLPSNPNTLVLPSIFIARGSWLIISCLQVIIEWLWWLNITIDCDSIYQADPKWQWLIVTSSKCPIYLCYSVWKRIHL